MYPISVLEYKQMSGRAGRPQYDEYGEALLIASSSDEQDNLMENYVIAKPERLFSRLAQESAMRGHTLAAVASARSSLSSRLMSRYIFSLRMLPPGTASTNALA